jgi:hypothetical protein
MVALEELRADVESGDTGVVAFTDVHGRLIERG